MRSIFFRIVVLFSIPLIFSSCAITGKSESPFVRGWGIYTMPGFELNSGTSLHGTLGYTGYNFGGGHTNFLQFGPQLRWDLDKASDKGPWIGAEATYVNIRTKYDNSTTKPKGSGFTIGAAGGYNFKLGPVPLNVYIAPAYLHRGDLKSNGMVLVPASNGFLGRIGVDIPFMTLLSKTGR